MSQYLIIPLNKAQLTAGYKNTAYRAKFGFPHYGMDLSNNPTDDRTLWGMGEGTVTAAGYDNVYGNVVVVVYPDVYIHKTGQTRDLTVRLYHLASLSVRAGQKVTTATKLGVMGSTGQYSTGPHVHIEIDTDAKMSTYGPGLAKSSNIIKKGVDTTLRPADVLYLKPTAPDYQTLVFAAGNYAAKDEAELPEIPTEKKWMVEVGPMTRVFANQLVKQIDSPTYQCKVVEV